MKKLNYSAPTSSWTSTMMTIMDITCANTKNVVKQSETTLTVNMLTVSIKRTCITAMTTFKKSKAIQRKAFYCVSTVYNSYIKLWNWKIKIKYHIVKCKSVILVHCWRCAHAQVCTCTTERMHMLNRKCAHAQLKAYTC